MPRANPGINSMITAMLTTAVLMGNHPPQKREIRVIKTPANAEINAVQAI